MLCDQVLGNVYDGSFTDRPTDWLDLTWRECYRRSLRKATRAGFEVRLLLPLGRSVGEGDVVYHDPRATLVVHKLPAAVLVARPTDWDHLGRVAVELGNLHVPVEVRDGRILTPPDGPAEGVFKRYNVRYEVEQRQFTPIRASVMQILEVSVGLELAGTDRRAV